ncbi:aldo/keto reductase [Clostridiaceae bacterium M8S5]|nr:aldo/keto reductase [Clostridiaceae bacterium M8S5]
MISKLTLGTAQLGMNYGINNNTGKNTLDENIKILKYAYVNGIKSIDTAPAYGDSEELIGEFKSLYNIKDLYITSKIPSLSKLKISKSEIPKFLKQQIYSSLKNLQVDKIDNLLVHDFSDMIQHGKILAKTMQDLKSTDLVNEIGCSIYDLDNIDLFLEHNFDTIQFPASIFNSCILTSKEFLLLKAKNIKTFSRSAFVQGLIFMDADKLPLPLSKLKSYIIKLNNISQKYNLSKCEIALKYLLTNKKIDSIVLGVDNINQLKELVDITYDTSTNVSNININDMFSDIPSYLVDPRNWRL